AGRGRSEQPRAAEGERHDGADDDLAAARLARRRQRRTQARRRQRDDDDIAERRRLRVLVTDDRELLRALAQLDGLVVRARRIARADDDRVTGERPSGRETRALFAGAAEDRDVNCALLTEQISGRVAQQALAAAAVVGRQGARAA